MSWTVADLEVLAELLGDAETYNRELADTNPDECEDFLVLMDEATRLRTRVENELQRRRGLTE